MPADEDYGRRQQQQQQITSLQQAQQQHGSPSPAPAGCPAGCPGGDAEKTAALDRSSSDRLPSGERYQGVSERYPLGERPHTSVSSERLAHQQAVADRQAFLPERYQQRFVQGSLDRYHYERYQRTSTPTDRYHALSADKNEGFIERYPQDKTEMFKRPASAERKSDRYPYRYGNEYYHHHHHQQQQQQQQEPSYPAIPCPERFATSFTQVPYMEPPSPAPAGDRFVPPPPLSPENDDAASPDCYPSNPFPSPTAPPPPAERFVPPPPLSPSPTEAYSPKKAGKNSRWQYERYHRYYPGEKYMSGGERYGGGGERYVPPNAHTPVERYIPQPQEQYYYHSFDRFPKFAAAASDPYMRRDLAFHYRLPLAYPPSGHHQYQRLRYLGTPSRLKCCQFQDYHHSKSSPGSSSSSSVTSQGKEVHPSLQDCQCYQQQEKAVQCGFKECPGYHLAKCGGRNAICASPSVEYVGQSGGRHVCATPPPRGAAGEASCGEQCCARRTQNTLTVAIWRGTAPQAQQPPPGTISSSSTATTTQDPTVSSSEMSSADATNPSTDHPPTSATPSSSQDVSAPSPKPPPVQRAVSLPAPAPSERCRNQGAVGYSQSERSPRERPVYARSASRREALKNYIKKETANFFGVDEETEVDQQQRWLDRRKRLACRTYGPLKDEYKTPPGRFLRRAVSDAPTYRTTREAPLHLIAERPDVLPGPSDVPDDVQDRLYGAAGVRGKDSVARMTWDGLSYVVSTLTRHRPRQRTKQTKWSRSFPPETPSDDLRSAEEDVFFDRLPSPALPKPVEDETDAAERDREQYIPHHFQESAPVARYRSAEATPGWRRNVRDERTRPSVGRSRIYSSLLDRVLDNSDRRQYGMGWVGRLFGRSMRRSVTEDEDVMQQLDDIEDHRPMFTYWVTTVQVLVLVISLICYGFGPFGFDLQTRSGQVLVTSLSLQQVDYLEPANFWFGPRAADLIHLGAKFAPCMRVDNKIIQQIDKTKAKERETACCIRNDDSGCVQSSQADCSKTIATWKKWSAGDAGPGGRISGSVCGLDPKFCDAPASVHPYEWPDDITKWPICRKTNSKTQSSIQRRRPKDKLAEHMVCEVIGHPCCIGIHGQCRITTREYCDFVRGTFHEEASLCSQVSCLDDVCGMVPFYFPQTPDQFYRLWTSLFLHAGVVQLVITVLLQHFLMRDLEKLTGSLRIGIIYIGSGVAGNLASAIFVPYRADVGPAGSQFGLLACLIVEVLNAWPMLKHPNQALCKLISITIFLFFVGLLPWVDNYAHLFGFVFGFLLSYALLPFVSFGPYDRQKKVALIWVCLVSAGSLFVLLVLLFYVIPVYDCKVCSYFNCLPITNDFCASQNINFKREEPIV